MIKKSLSPKETENFGEELVQKILKEGPKKRARVIALMGDLGSGKTTLTQGIMRGLGLRKKSPSPTFILSRRYKINKRGFKNVFHIDAYRLKNEKEAVSIGIKESLEDPQNILVVEWAENIKKIFKTETVFVRLNHGKKEGERSIST